MVSRASRHNEEARKLPAISSTIARHRTLLPSILSSQRPQTSTMNTKKSILTIALAATLAACGGTSSSDDDATNQGPTDPTYANCSAGTKDLDGITYTFPATSHGDTSQATATNQIEGGEQKWVANAYCNNGVVELSDPKVESTICFGGYQNVGDICEAIIYESCPAQTRIEGDFGTQFSFPEQPHGASETISNLFIATNEEFPEKVDFGSDEIFESLTSDCNDGERIQRDYSVLQTSLNCPAGEQEIGEVNYSFPLTAHNSTINLSGTKTIDGGSQNTSIEGYCANTDMTFSEPVVESVSCDNGYEQSGNSCIRVYNSCPAQTITYGDFSTQFNFPEQEHLASQTASSSIEATNEEFPNLIDFGTYNVDEELTSDCNDGERIQRDYSVLQTSLNCPAGEQEIEGVNYSFPLTAHNSTINLSGTKTIDGGSQNTSIEGYCANTDMTFSEPVVESVSCDNGYEQSGNSCIRVYNSCPAQTITQGDFGTQFSFPQQEHLASQTASNSFEATNEEFPNLIDFGTHNVDEELTSDCNDGERIQRDYSVLQTSLNCPAGEQEIEGVNYSFPLTAHNSTIDLSGTKTIDGGSQNTSIEGYCANTDMTFSEPVVESVSCDNGYEQNGNSCVAKTYESCPAQTITYGDFSTQFNFPEQEHLASQTASSSIEATNEEFPNLIDFGTYNVDEELTSDCNDGERTQRDYSILQTDMNCDAGSTTFEDTTFNFERQAHNTTFTLNAQESDDYNTTTSSADFSCENTVVSYENNFNQTTEYKELDQSTIIQALQDFYAMAQSSQENNVTFYGTQTDDNNNTYNVNYTNLKGGNGLEGILMGHIPDQPDQNVYVIGKDPTGLAYLDFQIEDEGLQDIKILEGDMVNNDSNIAGTLQEGMTLPEIEESMEKLKEGNFVYTDQGLLVYVSGGNSSSNPSTEFLYFLRNANFINREDHGKTRNNLNISSGIGPNYSFGTPFLRDNNGDNIEVQTHVNFNPIGNYNDGTFNLNQNLIDIIEGIQKLDKSELPNASYSLMIPISNTSNGNTKNFPLGPFHKGLMGIPTMTRNNNNRINLGTFLYCPGNGTYDTEFDDCS